MRIDSLDLTAATAAVRAGTPDDEDLRCLPLGRREPRRPTGGARGAAPPPWRQHGGRAQDDHLDELVRELQLVRPGDDEPELAPVIRGLLDGQAQARHMGRRTAQDAASEGRAEVTVEMVMPSAAADDVERLDEAVAAADALCGRERLLTLASPPEVRALRWWMRDEVREQIRHGRPPRSYDERRAAPGGT